jgi:hypothetical protein
MTHESARWMQAVWGALGPDHLVEATVKIPNGKWVSRHMPLSETIAEADTGIYTRIAARAKNDVYAGMVGLSQAPEGEGRGSSALRDAGGCLWMDVDCVAPGRGKANLFETIDEALTAIDATGQALGLGSADVVVNSGWGVHVAWLLSEPVPPLHLSIAIRMIENALSERSGRHVDHVGDATRVLRIPGTLNRRGGDGPDALPVTLERCIEDRRRSWDSIRFALGITDSVLAKTVHEATTQRGGTAFSFEGRALLDAPSLFEMTTSWRDVLLPFGWTCVGTNDSEESWIRPGKEDDQSLGERSAVVYADAPGLLVVYTDSPTGLTSLHGTNNRISAGAGSIDRWRAWVDLMWDGNWGAALNDALTRAYDGEGDLGTWPGEFIDELTKECEVAMRWAQSSHVAAVDRWARGL